MNHNNNKKTGASNNQAEMQGRYSKHQIDRVRSRAGSGSQWSSCVTSTSSVSSATLALKSTMERDETWRLEQLRPPVKTFIASKYTKHINTSLTKSLPFCRGWFQLRSQPSFLFLKKSWLGRTCQCLKSYEKNNGSKWVTSVATAQQPHNPTVCRVSFHKSSKNFQQVSGFVMDVPLHPRGWGGWLWDLAQMLCSSSTLGFA